MFLIICRCENYHVDIIRCENMTRETAERFAGLMDGRESNPQVGRAGICCKCRAPYFCRVKQVAEQ